MFAAAHAPASWPLPKPFHFGLDGNRKYRQVRAATGSKTITIGAGKTALVLFDPYSANAPVLVSNSTTPAATLATDSVTFSTAEARKDGTTANLPKVSDYITYLDANPCSFFEDPSSIKTGNVYLVPSSDIHPLPSQMQAASMHIECMTPYGGSAVIHTISPGDCPAHVGRNSVLVNTDRSASFQHENLVSHIRHPYHRISDSPTGFAEKYGVTRTLPGNSKLSVSIAAQPHTGWTFTGRLDATDAVDGNVNNSYYGFYPAFNVLPRMNDGYAVIQNTSSTDSMTVVISARLVFAYIVEPDDAARTLGALASSVVRDSVSLMQHLPLTDVRGTAAPSIGGTLDTVRKDIANAVHRATGSVEAAVDAAKSFGSKHSTVLEMAGAGAAYKTGLLGRIGNFARSVFGTATEEAAAVGRYVAPTVEEVFEGAEAVGGALEGAAPLLITL